MSTPIRPGTDPDYGRPAPVRTPRPPGGDPGYERPSPGSEGDLQRQMKALKTQLDRLKKDVADWQKITSKLGSSVKDQALKAMYATKIMASQSQITKIGQEYTKVENKYFEKSGQYEKLLKGGERDAFMALNALFKNYDLGTLAGKIFEYVKNGYSADTISILLQDTKEYKERFAGNEIRKQKGLPVLAPAEYLSTEAAYRQIMESAGLPKGFYDSTKDFSDFIGKGVSPSEIQTRVDLAVQGSALASEAVKKALKQMGISQGEVIAYFLDEKKSMTFITKAAATARLGAEALEHGLAFDIGYAEGLAKAGISAEEAARGYSSIADEMGTLSTLASLEGRRWTQREAEQATFEGQTGATQKRRGLASQERGRFGGSTGAARGGLAQKGGQK